MDNCPKHIAELRDHAQAIWVAALSAVRPEPLMREAFADLRVLNAIDAPGRILVVGAGKAGASMSAALEDILAENLDRLEGVISVPAECVRPLRRIKLVAGRPAGVNQPTQTGVLAAQRVLDLVQRAKSDDVCLCLLSGGGSALLPAPVAGVTLADKQRVTQMLHACGATINEMNAVRKHLSRIKGGQLAAAFRGRALISLVISDVIGDPLDVIASGPTAPDPTTFVDAWAVVEKYQLTKQLPPGARQHLQKGLAGGVAETPKLLPESVRNLVIGNNARALQAAAVKAVTLGYRVLNLGSYVDGETREVAAVTAGVIESIQADSLPLAPPACVLIGGETTVTLGDRPGLGGRNQEFALAAALKLRDAGLENVVLLSGGTDGEDGPTDVAGASADVGTMQRAAGLGLDPREFLARHDAYHFFESAGGLIRTGLTGTNVMDVRIALIGTPRAS